MFKCCQCPDAQECIPLNELTENNTKEFKLKHKKVNPEDFAKMALSVTDAGIALKKFCDAMIKFCSVLAKIKHKKCPLRSAVGLKRKRGA